MCSATDCCEPSHKPVSNLMFLFPWHLSAHSPFPSCTRHIPSPPESPDSNFLQNKHFLPPSHLSFSLPASLLFHSLPFTLCPWAAMGMLKLLLQLLPTSPSARLLPPLMALQTAAEGELSPATTTSYLAGSPKGQHFTQHHCLWN